MLEMRYIRENAEKVREYLKNRKSDFDLDGLLKLDEERRNILQKVELLKKERNESSTLIGKYKKEGKDTAELMDRMQRVSGEIKELDKIPTLNDKQKEIINKAKFEDPREPKDIMAEFFISNANKADQEIQAAKDDILKAGLDRIIPSNSDMGDNSVEDEIYKAALNAYNDEEK